MFTKEEEEQWKESAKRNAEAMANSKIFIQLWNPAIVKEALPCMQLGMAILLDKPVHMLVPKGQKIPENMRRLARSLVEFDGPGDIERATEELLRQANLSGGHNVG